MYLCPEVLIYDCFKTDEFKSFMDVGITLKLYESPIHPLKLVKSIPAKPFCENPKFTQCEQKFL